MLTIDDIVEKGYKYDEVKHLLNPRRANKEKRLLEKDKLTHEECDWLIRNNTEIPPSKIPKNYRYQNREYLGGEMKYHEEVSPETQESIYDMYLADVKIKDIANRFGFNKDRTYYYIQKMKRENPERFNQKIREERKIIEKEKKNIISFYKRGINITDISRKTGRSNTYIRKILKKGGVYNDWLQQRIYKYK